MKMLNYIAWLSGLALLLTTASCGVEDQADDAGPRLSVDKSLVEITRNGQLSTGSNATVLVIANKGYEIVSDQSWLSVNKPTGEGYSWVTIKADANDTEATRTGNLTVRSHHLVENIKVVQTIAQLDLAKVFYSESFDWAIPIAKPSSDPISAGAGNSNRWNIYSDDTGKDAWAANCKLTDWNPERKAINLYMHYIHFNSNSNFDTGVILPEIDAEGTVNATISFDACKDGGGSGDTVPIVVEITDGPGTIVETGTQISDVMIPAEQWKWHPMEVTLNGITSETKIAIHTNGGGANKYCRWFLDNIQLKELLDN
ncbi:MAG: BACON domain-containing protein [Muribaculum sp.]|nr:BACON domain-containing protein [Muribaculum sp.]